MSVKIVNHCFHDLYLFEYFTPENDLKDGKPNYLYADWPILCRAPFAYRKEDSNTFEKIKKDAKLLNKLIYGLKDETESDCESFITLKESDFSKYRQLFHGMLNSCSFEHGFDINLNGSSQKLPNGNTCEPPEEGEKERECCCPPEVPEDLDNTPCNRNHTLSSNCSIKQDSALLFQESNLEKRSSAATAIRKMAKRKLVKDSKESEKLDELDLEAKVFKDDWKFDSEAFKQYLKNTQNRFMRDRTRINDPVLSMARARFSFGTPYTVFEDADDFKDSSSLLLDEAVSDHTKYSELITKDFEYLAPPQEVFKTIENECMGNYDKNIYSLLSSGDDDYRLRPSTWSYVPSLVTTLEAWSYFDEEQKSETTLQSNFNSSRMGSVDLSVSSSHMSNLGVYYGLGFNFGRIVYNKEAKEYYIFVFLNTYLWFNKNWFLYIYDGENRGRFTLLPSKETLKKREFLSHSLNPTYTAFSERFDRKKEGFEEPKKVKLNLEVELENSKENFTFEIYEKKTMSETATEDTTEESINDGSMPGGQIFEECFEANINTKANYKELKLKLKTWKKSDFSDNATFPNVK